MERRAHQQRRGERLADGEHLGCLFPEHDVQECDQAERKRERHRGRERGGRISEQKEEGGEHLRHERFAQPAQPEAGQSDPELGSGEVSVDARRHPPGRIERPTPPGLIGRRIELRRTDLDDRELRRDEEPVEQHQHENRRDLQQEDTRRVPRPRDPLVSEPGSEGAPGARIPSRIHSATPTPPPSGFFIDTPIPTFQDGEPGRFGFRHRAVPT